MPWSTPKKPTTVLIVEDEALIRIELAGRLASMGLTVLAARDADEAIVLLDAHPEIELLMTDISMPGSMDGLKLAHHVRLRWPPLKIIVASGWIGTAASDLPKDSLFLPKPFSPDTLASALEHLLLGGEPHAPATPARSRG